MLESKNILIGAGNLYLDGRHVGYTRDGVTFGFERTVYDVEADQALNPVLSVRTGERFTVVTNLLEATLENLKAVWDIAGSIEASEGQRVLHFGGGSQQLTEHEIVFIGVAPGGFARTVTLYRAVSVESGEHAYRKGEETRIPVTFLGLEDGTKEEGQRLGSIVDETA